MQISLSLDQKLSRGLQLWPSYIGVTSNPQNKTPRTYDQKTFRIDGRIDVDISFQQHTMKTPVYIKMDAKEQLLLSEGVCRQLGVVTYHPSVVPGQQGTGANCTGSEVCVPTVRVMLMKTLKLKPDESAVVNAKLVSGDDGARGVEGDASGADLGTNGEAHHADKTLPLLLLETDEPTQDETGVQILSALVQPSEDGAATVLLTNRQSFTHRIEEGTVVGAASSVTVVDAENKEANGKGAAVNMVCSGKVDDLPRQRKLLTLLDQDLNRLPEKDRKQLVRLLERYHGTFSLMEGERGETDLAQIHIDTGDAPPLRQVIRRIPHAVRHEVAKTTQTNEGGGSDPTIE